MKSMFLFVTLLLSVSAFAQVRIGVQVGRPLPPPPYGRPYPAPYPSRPTAPPAQVCFYEHKNFSGQVFCLYNGQNVDNFKTIPFAGRSSFNDAVSSISIPPGVVVTVYEDAYFSGRRITFNQSVSSLSDVYDGGYNWSNEISSVSFGY